MKRIVYILVVLGALSLFSCIKEGAYDRTDIEVRVGSTDKSGNSNPETRSWSEGDRIGIFMISNGTTLSQSNIVREADNRIYVLNAGGEFEPLNKSETIYYPVDGSAVDFISYFPHTDQVTSSFTIPVDVSVQGDQHKMDLLYSNNVTNKSNNDVVAPLDFGHVLSRFEFNISASGLLTAADLAGLEISAEGFPTKAVFSLVDGSITSLSAVSSIEPVTEPDGTFAECTMLPTPTGGWTGRKFVVKLASGREFTHAIDAGYMYRAGYKYIFNVELSEYGIDIKPEIKEWVPSVEDRDVYPNHALYLPNCYMVKPGDYQEISMLKAYAVWGTQIPLDPVNTDLSGDVTAGIIWQDVNGIIEKVEVYGKEKKATIMVHTSASKGNGNAVIGGYINGILRWSWHIWITDYDPDNHQNGTTYTYEYNNNGATEFMDRNIGATSATPSSMSAVGLYFQGGRKDPFPKSVSNVMTSDVTSHVPLYNAAGVRVYMHREPVSASPNIANSIHNPMTFYTVDDFVAGHENAEWYSENPTQHYTYFWRTLDNKKGIYDPCPKGWITAHAFNTSSAQSPTVWSSVYNRPPATVIENWGMNYTDAAYNIGYYPFAGMIRNTTGQYDELGYAGCIWLGSTYKMGTAEYFYTGFFFRYGKDIHNPSNRTRRSYGWQVRCIKGDADR